MHKIEFSHVQNMRGVEGVSVVNEVADQTPTVVGRGAPAKVHHLHLNFKKNFFGIWPEIKSSKYEGISGREVGGSEPKKFLRH